MKELKAFRKVFLQPGEKRQLEFEIGHEQLAFWDVHMKFVVEPGEFAIMAGTSSRDSDLQSVTLLVV